MELQSLSYSLQNKIVKLCFTDENISSYVLSKTKIERNNNISGKD